MVFTTRSARPYLISWLRPWIMGMSFIVNNLLKSQKSFYYIISKSFWKLFKSNFWTNTAAPNICKNLNLKFRIFTLNLKLRVDNQIIYNSYQLPGLEIPLKGVRMNNAYLNVYNYNSSMSNIWHQQTMKLLKNYYKTFCITVIH